MIEIKYSRQMLEKFTKFNNLDISKISLCGIDKKLKKIPNRSPFGKVSNLLSSRTEFKFSTHSGSTSPSNIIQWRFAASPLTLSTIRRRMAVKSPSVHSRVLGSRLPYNSSFERRIKLLSRNFRKIFCIKNFLVETFW